MSIASEPKLCPKCGAAIPAEAPQGLCPKCLLLEISVPTEAGQGGGRSAPPSREELSAAFPQLEILELIGQGGMGFVFKARQPKLDRFVALKILPQSLAADPAFAERFTREGRLLARLNHPNIVTVHDFGVASGILPDVEPGFQPGGKGVDEGDGGKRSNAPHEPPPFPASGHPLPRSERGRGKGEGAQPGSEVQSANLRAENSPSIPDPDPRGRMPRSTSGKMPDATRATEFFYLLMEYVDGVNLRQAMKAGRFTPEQALAVVPKICEALQFAHNEGILHRDIKPENILLDTKGRVKIADFGIAKLVSEAGGRAGSHLPADSSKQASGAHGVTRPTDYLTHAGKTLGTPNYMAPEQIATPGAVDHRADIYSLGVVFYEMLTGELPLGRFAPPSQKSAADPRLDDVVLRALEKEPNRRTQSAGEVKTQVETIATEQRPPIIPASAASSTAKSFLRRGVLVGVIVFFIVISVTILATFLSPKTYMSESKLFLRPLNQLVKPEISLDSSDEILRKVVEDLHLKERWATRIDELEKRDPSLLSNRNSDVSVDQYRKTEAIILLKRSLKITQPSNSSVVRISFSGPNPTEPTEILGAVVLGYLSNAAQYQTARISLIQKASPPFPLVRPLPLIFPGGIVGLILGFTSGLMTTFFSRRCAGQTGKSIGEEAARKGCDERARSAVAESRSGRSTQSWMKWLGTGLVSLGIPVGIFGLVMLYLVLQDKSWNPAQSEAIVCFSAWIGTFILFVSGFMLIKASRAACGKGIKGLLAVAVAMAVVLGGGLVVEANRQLTATARPVMNHASREKIKPAKSESPLVLSPVRFDTYDYGPDQMDWGFNCFVPPDHLATFLFVNWSNGVPEIDTGFSAYIKVGKAGGIDVPFCSLSCHRIKQSIFGEWTEEQRKKIFADRNIPDSVNPANIVQWNVNLGGGFTSSRWNEMPPYHRIEPNFPLNVRSGYQRAIRLINFDNSRESPDLMSGVELRVFLEPLTLPSIRTRANEINQTNYVYGKGIVGTMEEALIKIKSVPLEEGKLDIGLPGFVGARALRETKARLAELRVEYTDEHPTVKAQLVRLRELERMVRDEPNASSALLEVKAKLAEKRIEFSDEHPEVKKLEAKVRELENK